MPDPGTVLRFVIANFWLLALYGLIGLFVMAIIGAAFNSAVEQALSKIAQLIYYGNELREIEIACNSEDEKQRKWGQARRKAKLDYAVQRDRT